MKKKEYVYIAVKLNKNEVPKIIGTSFLHGFTVLHTTMEITGSSIRLKGNRTKDPEKKTCKSCKIILDNWKIKW